MLTELEQEEMAALDTACQEEAGNRQSQRRLAEELTLLVHGESGLEVARQATEIFFGAEIDNLNDAQLNQIFTDVPSQECNRARLGDRSLTIVEALVETGLSKSKGEARRTVQQGGAYVNNRRIQDIETPLTSEYLASETVMVLRSGKKKYALMKFV